MASQQETAVRINNVKRKRTRERANVTRFINAITVFNENTAVIEYEHHRGRLEESLTLLMKLDDEFHDLLSDTEYCEDIKSCDDYINKAKQAILHATKHIEKKLSLATADLTLNQPPFSPQALHTPLSHSIKLPTIKLEPFSGDIESWQRFWEQFKSSVDDNPSLSTINKHVFLRGYLDGEPKLLVDGIAVTAATYEETKKILHGRYGDRNRIIQAHLDYLETIRPIHFVTPEALNTTFIECNRRIHALRSLGEDINAYGRILAPKILRAFPPDICQRWIVHVKRQNISEGDILKLMEFLNEEVDGAIITQRIRGDFTQQHAFTPTAATLHVNTKSKRTERKTNKLPFEFCVFCETQGHWAQDCIRIQNVAERTEKLKATNRCFLCLNRGHKVRTCMKKNKVSCTKCKKSHHVSICRGEQLVTTSAGTTSVGKIDVTPSGFTHLQTARIWITGPTGLTKQTRCVLDGGSQSSFIKNSLVDELGLEIITDKSLKVSAFETSSIKSDSRRFVRMTAKSVWNNFHVALTAFETSHSFSYHPTVPHDITLFSQTHKLQLADPTDDPTNLPIELLIGGDQYWTIVKDTAPIRLSSTVVLLPSKFGWILSGNRSNVKVHSVTVNFIGLNLADPMQNDDDYRQFWDLETLGISNEQPRPLNAKDSYILKTFHDSYRLEEGRRVVSLVKKNNTTLPNNRCSAEKRFQSLEKRLERNEELRNVYHEQMLDYIRHNQVEAEPFAEESNEIFYLPHHIVKKEKRENIKWRIVFDGSACERNMPSLNFTLEMGPNLLPEILSVLMRFRLHPMIVVGDIKQAFLQLVLDERDRDLTRFFWRRTEQMDNGKYVITKDVITYRFKTLPFGLTCSPFLLCAALRENADLHKEEFPRATASFDKNMYMDDFAGGGRDEKEVISLYYQLVSLMKRIRMPMGKWATNSQQLKAIWRAEGQEIKHETQVLGVEWDTESDCFLFDHRDVTEKISNSPATKRQLLQAIATFYDPLGLLSPTCILAKIIFQDTWCRGIGWDELIPHDLAVRWHHWKNSLTFLSQVHIPRHVDTTLPNMEIHVFCDASERAYGAVIYARCTTDGTTSLSLLCSKSRLAPVKKVTLPRLELLAALVGVRLLRYFCQATDHAIKKAVLWSDSTVTLGWIRGNPNNWKTFVCNRVTEILSYTAPSQWRHCPGECNPADSLSRGLPADELISFDLWWSGPEWIVQPSTKWPKDTPLQNNSLPEMRHPKKQVMMFTTYEPLLQPSQFSSYWKIIHITAWVHRFIQVLKGRARPQEHLIADEIRRARLYWIRIVQRDCFPEELTCLEEGNPLPKQSKISCFHPFLEDGLIRLGGRLQFANLAPNEKHPVLLDGTHHFTKLLIQHTHVRLHHLGVRIVLMELREEFWILRARQTIKKVLHECLPCKIARNKPADNIEAPLPLDRIRPLKPFSVSGVDFAGPLYIRSANSTRKAYIVLFTCATTRAIHLELATDLSTDRFLMAFQRFVGRRGLPRTIYSDNAKSFQAASKELQDIHAMLTDPRTHRYLSHHNVTWKFIPPRAAWWGGWWERMIGSVKRCMRKTLGKLQIDEEETNTLLISIEAALNSRPLSPTEDEGVLTPAHFLTGEKLTTIPSAKQTPEKNLSKLYKHKTKIMNDFWRRWTKDYLLELRSFHTVRTPCNKPVDLKVGDVVLLQEDQIPRHMWKFARIEELRPGRDGRVRTVLLRTTQKTQITRPIQLIVPLEIGTDQGGEDVVDSGQPLPSSGTRWNSL